MAGQRTELHRICGIRVLECPVTGGVHRAVIEALRYASALALTENGLSNVMVPAVFVVRSTLPPPVAAPLRLGWCCLRCLTLRGISMVRPPFRCSQPVQRRRVRHVAGDEEQGDGEIQEGQVWEAAMEASHHKLDNLVGIVDRNRLQIDGWVKDVMNVERVRGL